MIFEGRKKFQTFGDSASRRSACVANLSPSLPSSLPLRPHTYHHDHRSTVSLQAPFFRGAVMVRSTAPIRSHEFVPDTPLRQSSSRQQQPAPFFDSSSRQAQSSTATVMTVTTARPNRGPPRVTPMWTVHMEKSIAHMRDDSAEGVQHDSEGAQLSRRGLSFNAPQACLKHLARHSTH